MCDVRDLDLETWEFRFKEPGNSVYRCLNPPLSLMILATSASACALPPGLPRLERAATASARPSTTPHLPRPGLPY